MLRPHAPIGVQRLWVIIPERERGHLNTRHLLLSLKSRMRAELRLDAEDAKIIVARALRRDLGLLKFSKIAGFSEMVVQCQILLFTVGDADVLLPHMQVNDAFLYRKVSTLVLERIYHHTGVRLYAVWVDVGHDGHNEDQSLCCVTAEDLQKYG